MPMSCMQIFTGEGRNKRAAEHAAASAALAFIDSLGMLAPAPRPQMQPPPTMVSEAPVTAEEVGRRAVDHGHEQNFSRSSS